MERFHGYCFDREGFHTPAVELSGGLSALQYVKLQMGLQYRVIITDDDDSICIEAVSGKIVFPAEERNTI